MAVTVGSFLSDKRGKGRSQKSIADKLEHVQITQSRLSEIENGQLLPDRVQEDAIADVLGFTADDRAAWKALIKEAEAERRRELAARKASTEAA